MAPASAGEKRAKRSKAWNGVQPPLPEWIVEATASMGFASMTPVQESTIPALCGNKDVVVEAITGSGKTLAFLIPIVTKMLRLEEALKKHHVSAIVIAPTRELSQQIYSVLLTLLAFHLTSAQVLPYIDSHERPPATTDLAILPQLLVGGTRKATEDLRVFLRLSPNLLVGTPGRLAELLRSPHVHTSSLLILILDEADRLLDVGFEKDLQCILELVPKQRRTGLFSASMSDAVQEVIRVGLRNPVRITTTVRDRKGNVMTEKRTPASLQMNYVIAKASQKWPWLCQLLDQIDPRPHRTIVFLSTCKAVDYFIQVLPAIMPEGYKLVSLHGHLKAEARDKSFNAFVTATTRSILLTTDVAARGLDIPQVDLVVQIDPPTDTKVFIHRCGRAGRAGRRGRAVVLLEPHEHDYVRLLQVRKTPIAPLTDPCITVSLAEAAATTAWLRARVRTNRAIFDAGKLAFVSWVQSYRKHQAASIFDVGALDWRDAADGWALLQLPRMPELKAAGVTDLSLGFDNELAALAFRDKSKEKKRQEQLAAVAAARLQDKDTRADRQAQKRRNEAWSAKQDKEQERVERRQKRRRKVEAVSKSKMTTEERQERAKLDAMIAEVRQRNVAKFPGIKGDHDDLTVEQN